jgi:hypothetical protein
MFWRAKRSGLALVLGLSLVLLLAMPLKAEPAAPWNNARVLDVDIARDRDTEERHGLLTVDKPDGPALVALFEAAECPRALRFEVPPE